MRSKSKRKSGRRINGRNTEQVEEAKQVEEQQKNKWKKKLNKNKQKNWNNWNNQSNRNNWNKNEWNKQNLYMVQHTHPRESLLLLLLWEQKFLEELEQ